jgi:bifunctional non-homologous end joining protein LigD
LLIKEDDHEARSLDDYDITVAEPDSVITGRDVDNPTGNAADDGGPPDAAAATPTPSKRRRGNSKAEVESLTITHAERVIDQKSGITKGELAAYYDRVSSLILPHLRGRPVSLVRAPEGVDGELFFQKHANQNELPGIELLDPALDPGHEPLLQIGGTAGLLGAAQMNVVELHTWNAMSNVIGKPDRFTLDLDPGEGVDWSAVQEATMLVRVLLDELRLPSLLKTSGGKGMHVIVPIRRRYGWDDVKGFAQALVRYLARILPDRFVAKSGPRNRVGRIFVDYLRNGFGATTVCAWSARARPGMGVSVPVDWDELPSLEGAAQWTVRTIDERLGTGNSAWALLEAPCKDIGYAMEAIGYTPAA